MTPPKHLLDAYQRVADADDALDVRLRAAQVPDWVHEEFALLRADRNEFRRQRDQLTEREDHVHSTYEARVAAERARAEALEAEARRLRPLARLIREAKLVLALLEEKS